MKAGEIIENYQGMFAKVIFVKNGLTHFSAWVKTKALAEQETVAVNRLNEFGLGQVLKAKEVKEKAPKAKEVKEKPE